MAYVNRTTIKWCSINYNADFLEQVNCTLKYSAKKSVIIWLSRFARSAVTIKRFLKYRLNFFMNAIKRLKNARKLPGFRIFEGKKSIFLYWFFCMIGVYFIYEPNNLSNRLLIMHIYYTQKRWIIKYRKYITEVICISTCTFNKKFLYLPYMIWWIVHLSRKIIATPILHVPHDRQFFLYSLGKEHWNFKRTHCSSSKS